MHRKVRMYSGGTMSPHIGIVVKQAVLAWQLGHSVKSPRQTNRVGLKGNPSPVSANIYVSLCVNSSKAVEYRQTSWPSRSPTLCRPQSGRC